MEKEKQVWTIVPSGRVTAEFTSKSKAYRECRRLNGKKSGGRRPYSVQRKYLKTLS
jgi:hypothetical protein